MIEFELGLESGLRKLLDPVVATRAPRRRRRLAPVPGFRLLSAMAVACLVIAFGIEATLTRSLNPLDWSHGAAQQLYGLQSGGQQRSPAHAGTQPQSKPPATSPAAAHSAPPTPIPNVPALPVAVPTVTPPALPTVP